MVEHIKLKKKKLSDHLSGVATLRDGSLHEDPLAAASLAAE